MPEMELGWNFRASGLNRENSDAASDYWGIIP